MDDVFTSCIRVTRHRQTQNGELKLSGYFSGFVKFALEIVLVEFDLGSTCCFHNFNSPITKEGYCSVNPIAHSLKHLSRKAFKCLRFLFVVQIRLTIVVFFWMLDYCFSNFLCWFQTRKNYIEQNLFFLTANKKHILERLYANN